MLPRRPVITITITTITTSQPEPAMRCTAGDSNRGDSPLRQAVVYDRPVFQQEELRYPLGRFVAPTTSTPMLRTWQIESLRRLPQYLDDAVRGLDDEQLSTHYREGGWTLRQVVHHLADSHVNAFIRFKLALTENWPTINPYDEAAWAKLPDSRILSIGCSLTFIDALHTRWATLLDLLAEEDFQRGYNHPKLGRQTLSIVLALYEWHGRHHTAHITALRQRRGW